MLLQSSYLTVLWLSIASGLQVEGQNKTLNTSIIKQLPDKKNMTVIDKDTIKPTQCLTPTSNKTSEVQDQDSSLENSPFFSIVYSINRASGNSTSCPNTNRFVETRKSEVILNEKSKTLLIIEEKSLSISKDMPIAEAFYSENDNIDYTDSESVANHDLGDFDELNRDLSFNDFGSNFKSEMFDDHEKFYYYEYRNDLVQEMLYPDVNIFNSMLQEEMDGDYLDFNNLFVNEEQLDYYDYGDALRYFLLIDNLTQRDSYVNRRDC